MTKFVCLWIHLIGAAAIFGSFFYLHFVDGGRSGPDQEYFIQKNKRLVNFALVLVFLSGLILFYLKTKALAQAGLPLSMHLSMVISLKFIFLVILGALVMMESNFRKQGQVRGSQTLRWAVLILVIVTFLLGISLRGH